MSNPFNDFPDQTPPLADRKYYDRADQESQPEKQDRSSWVPPMPVPKPNGINGTYPVRWK